MNNKVIYNYLGGAAAGIFVSSLGCFYVIVIHLGNHVGFYSSHISFS